MLSNICPGMILCNCRYKYAHRLNEKRFWGKKYATANYTRLQINFEKMKRGAIPQYDGKHYPYLQLEHLNNETTHKTTKHCKLTTDTKTHRNKHKDTKT